MPRDSGGRIERFIGGRRSRGITEIAWSAAIASVVTIIVVTSLGWLTTQTVVEKAREQGAELRWTPPVGQFGGLDKLGSDCRQAANFSMPDAQYVSSGVRPSSVECGRRVL